MSPITPVSIVSVKRIRPHVGEVQDWNAQQSLSLVWNRIFTLQEQLTAAQATIAQLVAGHNTNEANVAIATRLAKDALTPTMVPGAAFAPPPDEEDGGLPGGGDGGLGNEGCAAAGASGHDSGGLLTAVRAGQIACGTGNEFSALRNPTPTLEERLANREELLLRVIWHLKEAGFSAGRQQNPSGAISPNKFTVVVDAVLRAYDCLLASGDNTIQMQMSMDEVGSPVMVDDAGIADG